MISIVSVALKENQAGSPNVKFIYLFNMEIVHNKRGFMELQLINVIFPEGKMQPNLVQWD